MSTVVIGGGGPRPQARIVSVSDVGPNIGIPTYEIRDGAQVLAVFEKLSHAQALLPLIQSGE